MSFDVAGPFGRMDGRSYAIYLSMFHLVDRQRTTFVHLIDSTNPFVPYRSIMIPHQPRNHITRELVCQECRAMARFKMEAHLLQYDWTCPACGAANRFEDLEARKMIGTMRPEDYRK
jgi:hypothetical protein